MKRKLFFKSVAFLVITLSIFFLTQPNIKAVAKEKDLSVPYLFYKEQLKTKDKNSVYQQIAEQLNNTYPNDTVYLDTALNVDDCLNIANCFVYDNPSYFWTYQDTKAYTDNNGAVYFLKFPIVEADPTNYNNMIAKLTEDSQCYSEDYFKLKSIYEEVLNHVSYNRNPDQVWYNQSTYSAIMGSSVCLGISKLFEACAEEAGFPAITVLTDAPHAYNYVFIDSNWYFVDLTLELNTDNEQLTYFLLGRNQEKRLQKDKLYEYPTLAQKDFVDSDTFNKLTGKRTASQWSDWQYSLTSVKDTYADNPFVEIQEETFTLYRYYAFGNPKTPSAASPYWNTYLNGQYIAFESVHEYWLPVPFIGHWYSGTAYYNNAFFAYLDYQGQGVERSAYEWYHSTNIEIVRVFKHESNQSIEGVRFRIRTKEII